jgi:uncharacterized protein (DUF427 family)
VLYIPREEIVVDELVSLATSTHCPYKGDARCFAVRDVGDLDVAWSYHDPFATMEAIRGHLAFYADRVDAIESVSLG